MANKLYGVNVDYLVEGAKNNGYLKKSGKGLGDGATSSPVKDYATGSSGANSSWFEGKKGNVGVGGVGAKGL